MVQDKPEHRKLEGVVRTIRDTGGHERVGRFELHVAEDIRRRLGDGKMRENEDSLLVVSNVHRRTPGELDEGIPSGDVVIDAMLPLGVGLCVHQTALRK